MRNALFAAAALISATAAIVGPAHADPTLPNGADTVAAMPMAGPYAALDDLCKANGDADTQHCLAPPTECGATRGVGKLVGAFTESRVLRGCQIALRAPAGWFVLSTGDLPAWSQFLNNGGRYVSTVAAITPSADRSAVIVRGTFVHWTTGEKMPWLTKPAYDEWYECEDRMFVCSVGGAGPSCAGPFAVTYTTYCRDAAHPERALHRADPHDFKFNPTLAGTALTMAATRRDQGRTAPLPGWAVVALGAKDTLGQQRDLSPEHVTLQFP